MLRLRYGMRTTTLTWRTISVVSAMVMAITSCGEGLRVGGNMAYYALLSTFQELPSDYTESYAPMAISDPSRDEATQNGVWTTAGLETLYGLEQETQIERDSSTSGLPSSAPEYYHPEDPGTEPKPKRSPIIDHPLPPDAMASTTPSMQGQGTIGGGEPYPWEEAFPGGGSNGVDAIVNSNTGNRLTTVPLFSIPIRGGMSFGINLYHSSRTVFPGYFGTKWSCDFDAKLLTNHADGVISNSNLITLRWGNGQTVQLPYSIVDGAYKSPEGMYYKITRAGITHFPEWTLTTKHGLKFVFKMRQSGVERLGLLAHIEDRNGNRITITRQSNQAQILHVSDPLGRRINFGYNANGLISQVKDCRSNGNRLWTFTYDSSKLTTITYPSINGTSYTRQFAYDSNKNIITETDRRGKTWGATYDSSGRQTGFTEPVGITPYTGYTFEYQSDRTYLFDPNGKTQQHVYTLGRLGTVYDEAYQSVSYTWDGSRRVQHFYDKRHKHWQYAYDGNGNLLSVTTPNSEHEYYTYNSDNTLATTSHDNGGTVKHEYTTQGRWFRTSNSPGGYTPDRPLTEATLNGWGQPLTYKTYGPVTGTYILSYDTVFGYLRTITDPNYKVSTVVKNSLGWTTSVKDPLNNETKTEYDDWGRVTKIIHPGGVANVQVQYDEENNVTMVTDERGKSHDWVYNDAGWVTEYTNARDDVETYEYDRVGFLTDVTNGRGFTRSYLATARYEVKMLTMPDGTKEVWRYDANGRVAHYLPAYQELGMATQPIVYAYDDSGRPDTITYNDNGYTPNVDFTYSNNGHTVSMADGTGTTTWTYSPYGNLTSLVTPQGTMNYSYDGSGFGLGMRTSMTEVGSPDKVTTYEYDSLNRLKKLTNSLNEVTEWAYDNAGRMNKRTLGNGTWEDIEYDNRSRPTWIRLQKPGPTTLRTQGYTYDDSSNVATHTVDGLQTSYTYDDINQLLSEARSGYSCSYTYDDNGNRLTRTLNGLLETYTCDEGDKLTSVTWNGGSKNFTYDEFGRRETMTTAGATTTYVWDRESRLRSVSKPGMTTNVNSYNGLDARASRTDSSGLATYRRNGAVVTAPILSDGTAAFTPGVSESRAGTSRWLHAGIKNTDSHTTLNQSVAASRRYDAFGSYVTNGAWCGPFGYAGGYGYQEDGDTGLSLVGHRMYDRETGIFLSRDPASQGRNWYTYCDNNPLNSVDPGGLKKKLVFLLGNLGKLGGDDDLRDGAARLLAYVKEIHGNEYDIEVRAANNRLDWERAIADADAIVFVGHGGGGLTRDGRGVDENTTANGYRRRTVRGKGKLDFIKLYSCSMVTNQVEADMWLWVSDYVLGWAGTCYPGSPRIEKGEGKKLWEGLPSRKVPYPGQGGRRPGEKFKGGSARMEAL